MVEKGRCVDAQENMAALDLKSNWNLNSSELEHLLPGLKKSIPNNWLSHCWNFLGKKLKTSTLHFLPLLNIVEQFYLEAIG